MRLSFEGITAHIRNALRCSLFVYGISKKLAPHLKQSRIALDNITVTDGYIQYIKIRNTNEERRATLSIH